MNYYFNNAMRLEGDLMSRGKEVKELREKMGMNRREFSDYYGIPYRTVQDLLLTTVILVVFYVVL